MSNAPEKNTAAEQDEEMSAFANELSATLGVKCCKTMSFGLTVMDTNINAGRDIEIIHEKHQLDWSPRHALMLYPEIEDIEKSNNAKESLSMACSLVNGFAPYLRGIVPAKNMSRQAENFLEGRSITMTHQSFKARHDSYLIGLFSHLAWYGAGTTPIVPKDDKNKDTEEKLTKRGFICSAWKSAPPAIRYVVHLEPQKGSSDSDVEYTYLIGGSDDVIGDKLDAIPETIYALYSQIKNLKEEAKKSSSKKAKDDQTVQEDPKNLWFAHAENPSDPISKAHLLAKKMLRIIESVFFIRNYFVYASKNLVVTVEEVSYDKKTKAPKYTQVDIQKVIEKYDMIYAYCKNLCYMYQDIAKGDVV
jgi:hypothetical protein